MSVPARRRAAAVAATVLAAGLATVLAPPAAAEDLGLGWEGQIASYQATGEAIRVPVTFAYTGPPGSAIETITLDLLPQRAGLTDDRCPSRSVTARVGEGDGDGLGTTPTTPDTTGTTETTDPTGTTDPEPTDDPTVAAAHTFDFDPGCNGTYDLEVHATADPGGPVEPGDPGTESDPLVIENLRVALTPPPPTGVETAAAADRTITVRWTAPAAWTDDDGPTADADGYRVERDLGDGAFAPVGTFEIDQTVFDDTDLRGAPDGSYRYRVVALRAGATGGTVASSPAEGVVVLASPTTTSAPPATTVASTPAAPAPGVGRTPLAPGPGAAPSPAGPTVGEFDPGFDPELDYGEFAEEGAEEAVTPVDASALDLVFEDPVGAGLAVPFAVFACLGVWAAHLRHLSRRALAPPN